MHTWCYSLNHPLGLEALEAQDIRHRDINPGNLLLYEEPGISGKYGFIADFEFAKVLVPPKDELDVRRIPSEDRPGHIRFSLEESHPSSSQGPGPEMTVRESGNRHKHDDT